MGLKYLYAQEYVANSAGTLGTPTGNYIRIFMPYYPEYTKSDLQSIIGRGSITWGNKYAGIISDAGLAFSMMYPDLFMGTCVMTCPFISTAVSTLYGPFPNMYHTADTDIFGVTGKHYNLLNVDEKVVISIGPGSPYNGDLSVANVGDISVGSFTPVSTTAFMQGSGGNDNNPEYRTIVQCADGFLVFGVGAFSSGASDMKLYWLNIVYGLTEITKFYGAAKPVSLDPYEPGGNTDTGGGGGTHTDDNTPVDFSGGPTLGATDTGFITLFNPTVSELQALASYMWTDPLFDLANWKKIFADPMDAILGLSIVPVSPGQGGSRPVKVGNIATTVSMHVAASQYVQLDCGTVSVSEWWGAYLDYEPFTKAELYLPYCGTHPISIDEIMNGDIHVHYWVDILSGACVAEVKCKTSVLYTFAGQCASSIPITGRDWTNVINGVLNVAGSVGSMIATGGASAPASVAGLASAAMNTLKPSIEKSGSLGGTSGMLAGQTPVLILTRPNQAHPEKQNEFVGYPSFITRTLGDVEGYAEIEQVHLENIPATGDELSEIERLLKEGVIF